MQTRESIDKKEQRKKVYKLFYLVLSEQLHVRDALLNFPKDVADPTLTASWHALCHLEADEDIRKKDSDYAEEQDEYLQFIANTLSNGDELPQNIIREYLPYHNEALIAENSTPKGIWHKLKKFLCC